VLLAAHASLQIAIASVAFAFVVGVTIGVISCYRGGLLDAVLMRVVDVMFAFPVLLLALAIVAILAPGSATTILAIGIVYTPIFARVARASTLSVRVEPFVAVSRTLGTGHLYILGRHILPNIAGPLIVQTSVSLAFAILSEAALSFLGLGIQPPEPSWGRMLFDAQGFVQRAWWMGVFPGAAIFATVLAFNLLGDGLRDVLDPKQRTMIEARRQR
jgi:peptide/nickel transport system permease protein